MFAVMTVSMILGLALAAGAPEPVVWTKMVRPRSRLRRAQGRRDRAQLAKAGARRGDDPAICESAVVNLMRTKRDRPDDTPSRAIMSGRSVKPKQPIERARQIAEQAEPPRSVSTATLKRLCR